MSDAGLLFTSLVGSKVAEELPRFEKLQNQLSKHVLPPIPFLPFKNKARIQEENHDDLINNDSLVPKVKGEADNNLWKSDPSLPIDQQFFPLTFSLEDSGQEFLFPYEPMIKITGKNKIIRRDVARKNPQQNNFGSIKEWWSQDDYEITITGMLIGDKMIGSHEDCFPTQDFEKLRDFLIQPKRIKVNCEPLQLLGINYLVIESFDFPFTKGENVQAYIIKGYSDANSDLLKVIEESDAV